MAISPDRQYITTASKDRLARVFDLRRESTKPVPLNGHRALVTAVPWSPDSRTCATIGNDGRAILWSPGDGLARTMHPSRGS